MTKEDLIRGLNVVVTAKSLARCVSEVRQASVIANNVIATMARRGYMFAASFAHREERGSGVATRIADCRVP